MARDALRRLLAERLGAPGRAVLAWRTRAQAEHLLASRGLASAARAIDAACEGTVRRGPFAGLRYPRRYGDIVHAAKLLGAYECELHESLERLLARAPALIVNIGSGDGFYAVGIARRRAAAGDTVRVIAVDPDPIAQRACRDTARRNVVADRITPMSALDADGFDALHRQAEAAVRATRADGARPRTLVVIDAEGFEDEFVDLARAPSLARADLLIETHDFARAGVTARLTQRLAATHDVREVAIGARAPSAYPELAAVAPEVARGLLDEFRHVPQGWLVCTARG